MDDQNPCRCDICKVRAFKRNAYFAGKTLSANDLAEEQLYLNEKRRLINRAVIGWGIVCGLGVTLEQNTLVVEPGLALDCCGHEILVCDRQTVCVDSVKAGCSVDQRTAGWWVLCLEYRECRIDPVKPPGSCAHGEKPQYNRIQDGFRLTVRPWEKACPDNHHETCCAYDRIGAKTPLHAALTARSKTCPACRDCACVLLAIGRVDESAKPPGIQLSDESWKYRRLVYTNPALASVLRCVHGGLAHIAGINWKPGTEFKPDEFLDRLTKDRIRVTFDQSMKPQTVTDKRTCRLSMLCYGADGHCPTQLFIPVDRIDYDDQSWTATYSFDSDCIEQELRRVCLRLPKPAEVELVLRGNLLHNRHGRALDAELIDGFPTGNGVEGGEFVATFTVAS